MDVTTRVSRATKFIRESDITDEDLMQEIYLTALELNDSIPEDHIIDHVFELVCGSYMIRELEKTQREKYNPNLCICTTLLAEVNSDIMRENDDGGIIEILRELII